MRIFLVRHGQTEFNLKRQSQVGLDPPLNATGVAQCDLCSTLLDTLLDGQQFDAVFSSNLLRAAQTTALLMKGRPDPKFNDESSSLAEGCYVDALKSYTQELFKTALEQKFTNILVVSHSSVIKYMVKWLARINQLEVPPNCTLRTPRNCAIAVIQKVENNKAELVGYNILPEVSE